MRKAFVLSRSILGMIGRAYIFYHFESVTATGHNVEPHLNVILNDAQLFTVRSGKLPKRHYNKSEIPSVIIEHSSNGKYSGYIGRTLSTISNVSRVSGAASLLDYIAMGLVLSSRRRFTAIESHEGSGVSFCFQSDFASLPFFYHRPIV